MNKRKFISALLSVVFALALLSGIAAPAQSRLSINQLTGFGVAPSNQPITVTLTASPAAQTVDASSFTFSTADIGTATTGRRVVVLVGTSFSGAIGAFGATPVTIGGNTATQIAVNSDDNGIENVLTGIFALQVDTGTTADIVVTLDQSARHSIIRVVTLQASATTAADATTINDDDPAALNINTYSGGAIVGVVAAQVGGTITWTGGTDLSGTIVVETNYRYSFNAAAIVSASTPLTFTADDAGAPSNYAGAAASWQP